MRHKTWDPCLYFSLCALWMIKSVMNIQHNWLSIFCNPMWQINGSHVVWWHQLHESYGHLLYLNSKYWLEQICTEYWQVQKDYQINCRSKQIFRRGIAVCADEAQRPVHCLEAKRSTPVTHQARDHGEDTELEPYLTQVKQLTAVLRQMEPEESAGDQPSKMWEAGDAWAVDA